MIPEIEGGGGGYPAKLGPATQSKGREKKYGDGQRSTMSAHKDEWHAVRISRAAQPAAVLLSRAHPARARKDCQRHVGAAPFRLAVARRRELGAGSADEDDPDARRRAHRA